MPAKPSPESGNHSNVSNFSIVTEEKHFAVKLSHAVSILISSSRNHGQQSEWETFPHEYAGPRVIWFHTALSAHLNSKLFMCAQEYVYGGNVYRKD